MFQSWVSMWLGVAFGFFSVVFGLQAIGGQEVVLPAWFGFWRVSW